MSNPIKPTGFKRTFLRECFDVLSVDPPVLRWRSRPREHFAAGKAGDGAFKAWGKTWAYQTLRPDGKGRLRLFLNGRSLSASAIIAEIGVTPIRLQSIMPDGMSDDRLAEMREIAGDGPLAAIVRAAMAETGRSMNDLMVMSPDKDPYRMDTPAKHRAAQGLGQRGGCQPG